MKIDDSESIRSAISHKGITASEPGTGEFEEILKRKMSDISSSGVQESGGTALNRISGICMPLEADRADAVSRVADFLDIMEEYSVKLSRPQYSLKDLSPLISRMESHKQELTRLSESLPPDDGVKEILDKALIQSSVEVIRFNRGDYL